MEARRTTEEEIKKLTDDALQLEEEGRTNIQYIQTAPSNNPSAGPTRRTSEKPPAKRPRK
jgi:hypothetical protein